MLAGRSGSEIIFPSELRGGTQTINRARGWHRKIGDRFDLTLECIARWYQGKDSPLANVFDRYRDFLSGLVIFRVMSIFSCCKILLMTNTKLTY